ncbi:MAG: universal stress protein [Pseudomonadota bacterium]
MYKNILTATDGSEIALKATEHAIVLAKTLGAQLTAVVVTEPYETIAFTSTMDVIDPSIYRERTAAHADSVLAKVKTTAETYGVACQTTHKDNHYPYDGIINAAEEMGADLIVLGSHGRRGLERLLVGSEATKVLTHTKIPTLVVR